MHDKNMIFHVFIMHDKNMKNHVFIMHVFFMQVSLQQRLTLPILVDHKV